MSLSQSIFDFIMELDISMVASGWLPAQCAILLALNEVDHLISRPFFVEKAC